MSLPRCPDHREHLRGPGNPGALALEQSVAPSEGGQRWRCPRGHSRNTAPTGASSACLCSPCPAPGTPLPPQRLPHASLSDPAGAGLPPCSAPPPALWVSPCPSRGFGAAESIRGAAGVRCRQCCPASRLDWLLGRPGGGRQVRVDQASILGSLSRNRVPGELGHPGRPRHCALTPAAPGLPACLPRNLSPFTPTVSRKTGSRVSRMFSMSHKSPPPKVPQPNRLDEVYEALKKGLT